MMRKNVTAPLEICIQMKATRKNVKMETPNTFDGHPKLKSKIIFIHHIDERFSLLKELCKYCWK